MKKDIFLGATLLSVEEAEQVPKAIREFDGWWWLRSPGRYAYLAADVNFYGRVYLYGINVYYSYACVRPALQLNLESSNLNDGDKIKVGGFEFDVVCDGRYALCNTSIGQSAFREDSEAEDANDYESSDIKKFVDKWFDTKIKGREVVFAEDIDNNLKELFPDWHDVKPGEWSSYGRVIQTAGPDKVEIGLYREEDDEYGGSLTLQIFVNDDVAVCQQVSVRKEV